MHRRQSRKSSSAMLSTALAIVFCSVALSGTAATAAERIGVTAAAVRQVTGSIDGQERRLRTGLNIFRNERIRTGPGSAAQLTFLDQTSLTVGPNSAVVLDSYVYDPRTGAGDIAVRAAKGAFRFISGDAEKRAYKIRTPVGTMGVRGTIIDFFIFKDGTLLAINMQGAFYVRLTNGRVVNVPRPGTYVVIHPDGRTEGPRTWNRSVTTAIRGISFPLFGNGPAGLLPDYREPYDRQGIARAVRGPVPRPPRPRKPLD